MSTITIPAREVKAGDVIDFGGQPFTVAETDLHPDQYLCRGLLYLRGSIHGLGYTSSITIDVDTPLNVQRPDPDAELIEVMARAMGDRLEVHWRMDDFDQQTPADQENTRRDIRAALAAAREAGLL